MYAKLASRLVVTLVCLGASCACADEFAERCNELTQKMKVSAEFHDRTVVVDDSRNIQDLNRMSGKPAGGYHNVYGLTHAKPYFHVGVVAQAIADGRGRVCAIPDISINLGFSEMVIYLARELTDRCRRNFIREHEEEHANTWKAHLRASAQMLKTILQQEVGQPRTYASRDEAEAGIRLWADELVAPWVKRIGTAVREAQQAIDTPTSYAEVAGRLRTCPPNRP